MGCHICDSCDTSRWAGSEDILLAWAAIAPHTHVTFVEFAASGFFSPVFLFSPACTFPSLSCPPSCFSLPRFRTGFSIVASVFIYLLSQHQPACPAFAAAGLIQHPGGSTSPSPPASKPKTFQRDGLQGVDHAHPPPSIKLGTVNIPVHPTWTGTQQVLLMSSVGCRLLPRQGALQRRHKALTTTGCIKKL